jgi:PAS domain S-box-containing protein
MRLRSHLLLLAGITILPIVIVVCLGVVFLFKRMRDDQLQTVRATARALSLALDRSFQEGIATLTALSASKNLEKGDFRAFHEEAKRVLALDPDSTAIALVDPSGQQIVNTNLSFGRPLPRGRGSVAPKVVKTRKPVVSNLLTGPVAHQALVVLGVPVVVDGEVKYVLTKALRPAYLRRLLELQSIPAGYLCTVIDGNRIIVARNRDIEQYFGRPAGESLTTNSMAAIEGSWIGEPLEFQPVYAAHRRSEFSGWTVALGTPVSKIDRPLRLFLGTIAAGIVLLLLTLAGLSAFFGRRLVASVTALAEGAKALGSGMVPRITESPVLELDEVRRELESAAAKRSAMEAALRQSEERLRTIIETEPECIKVVAPDGTLLEINAAGLNMLEADALETARGKSIFDFVAPECCADLEALSRRVLAGEAGKLEFELIGLKGRRRWIETHAAPLRGPEGEIYALLAVSRDVTEHKRAEDALRASEERLKLALAASRMGVWEWDFETAVMFWSPECREILGRDLSMGSFESFTQFIHPEDAGAVLERVHGAIDQRTVYAAEFRLSSEPARWLANHGRAEYDPEGRPVRMIGTLQDITERKQLVAELQQRAAQLSEADRRKDEFLALLAHELRNPLAPVTHGLEILRLNALPNDECRHAADLIDEQMQHMARLIDDLLDVSRLTRGTLALRREEVEISEVIRSAVGKNQHILHESGVELAIEMPPRPLWLEADRVRLIQVISNLINNAAKYTEAGGVITVRVEGREAEALISVRDTGIGIPPDKLEHVFELFAQLDPSPQERTRGGLGLGLTLAKLLVELHGGTVEAKSAGLEKGSEFIVRLPALEERPAETARAPSRSSISLEGLKVLVVDDNRAAADMLATLFRLKGNPVQAAYDGEHAVKAAEAFQPDVVLLDLGMPKLNGYDACRLMREHRWGERMVIIAITGWGREEDRERTREAGFDYHLVKPVRPLILMDVIADLAREKLADRV